MIVELEKAKVAIILVNYNGYDDTRECVLSLESMSSNAGVIIVDNGSKDEMCKKIRDESPNVVVLISTDNLGFAGGNNLGIDYALKYNIEYIMLLNNDTVVDKDLLTELMKKEDPDTIQAPRMMYYKEPDRIWYAGGEFDKITGRSLHYHMNNILKPEYKDNTFCTFATGCCLLIPVGLIEDYGKLDDKYFMYCEDSEYCLRIITAGKKIKYVGNAVLWHKVSSSTGGEESLFSVYYMTRNRLLYLKTYKQYFSNITIPLFYVTRILRVIQYFIKGDKERSKVVYRALKDGINGKYGKSY
nr:glycosyltransferase family 2 protein [uncultured Anaerosporobacter sp.]